MKTKNKRNIGILLAAIMVTSVFAVVMPALGGWTGCPGYGGMNITIDEPLQDSCMRGDVDITWSPGTKGWSYAYTVKQNATGHWCCLDKEVFKSACAPDCNHTLWDTSNIACDKDVHLVVWNGTDTPWDAGVHSRNYTNFSVDNVDPCIVCNSPANGTWFNGTAAEGDAELNVSACDNCCGIFNISADISGVSDLTTVDTFVNRSSTGTYICGLPERCIGWYHNYTAPHQNLKDGGGADNTTVVTVTVRDNATDKNGVRGSATCAMEFGVDPTAPTPPTSIGCDNSTGGAIIVQWSGAVDPAPPAHPSGLHYYNIHYTKTNATGTYTGLLKTEVAASPYTFNPAVSGIAEYGATYTFSVTAVDYARNEGTHSADTPEQILDPGVPSQVVITNPPEGDVVTACDPKDPDYIMATIKDQFGVPVGGENYEVHVNATKGVTCPWKIAPIPGDGKVESAYKAPQWVPDCEPVAINVSLWNSTDNTYISSSIVNIEVCPKQADNIELTADPAMIPTNGSTSTITVQLIDENGYAVHLTGVDIVVTTNAGTFENGEQEVSGYTNETGTFIATLTSSKTPTLATVTADANSHWWMETVDVAFVGFGSYDIPLCAGWNLISLPLVPESTYAGTVLSGIAGNLSFACAYDGCTGNWTFGSFIPPLTWTGDLDTMNVLRGYWLFMNTPATLTVTGYTMVPGPFLPPTLDVCRGWNLVGYYAVPPDKVMTAGNYYNDVVVSYNMLGYDCESQGYFSVGAGDNLGSGKGYWMNANNNGEITPQEWL